MKTTHWHCLPLALALALLAAPRLPGQTPPAVGPRDFNAAVESIIRKHNPRPYVYDTPAIIAGLNEYAKTQGLSVPQQADLLRRVAYYAATGKDPETYDRSLAALLALEDLPAGTRAAETLFNELTHVHRGEAELTLAEALFGKLGTRVAPETRLRQLTLLAIRSLDKAADPARFTRHLEQVASAKLPDDLASDERRAASFQTRRLDELTSMLNHMGLFDPEEGLRLLNRHASMFDDRRKGTILAGCAKGFVERKERARFDAVVADLRKLPADLRSQPLCDAMRALARFDADAAETVLRAELAAPGTPDAARARYLDTLLSPALCGLTTFNYGFHKPGAYEKYKTLVKERLALIDKGIDPRLHPGMIEVLAYFDDLDLAEEVIRRAVELNPGDFKLLHLAARVAAAAPDGTPVASSRLDQALAVSRTSEQTNEIRAVAAFLRGEGLAGFNRAFPPGALDSAARLALLRKTSLFLFQARRYDDCRAILNEITQNLYAPEPDKIHVATYVPQAPTTADGFVRTPFYNDWSRMETRFVPYGNGYNESRETDAKRHLKDAVQPKTDPAFRTGIRVLYDEQGVHVFIRCDDPGIGEVMLGKRNAGGLEIVFRPGRDDIAYHSIFFDALPGTGDPHHVDWNLPGRHYRLTEDSFVKDTAVTPEGVVAHLGIPWTSVYDHLPADGNPWLLGLQRSCPGGMQTISGLVHELSRGMRIEFPFTPEQLTGLKRSIAVAAFNRYQALRNNKGKFLQTWNDPVLGDPAFYAAEVAPLLETLDAAGVQLMAPAPDADVERIFRETVPLWAEIEYEVADRRTRYLNAQFFAK